MSDAEICPAARPVAPPGWTGWDATGIAGSLACLAHCLLLPAAAAALPWLGAFSGEWLHQVLAVGLVLPALLAFVPGFRRHGTWLPGFLVLAGLAALNIGAFAAPLGWEAALTVAGGLSLIAAHGLNRHLCRCPRCSDDRGRRT